MKLLTTFLVLGFTLVALPTIAQENSTTLDNQFVDIIEKSNRYQDYKVVKIYKLNNLKKNVKDSIAAYKKTISTDQTTISQQQAKIATATQNIANLQNELTLSMQKEDGISLFGLLIKKSTYKVIMWSIIGLLGVLVFFLFYKFKNSFSKIRSVELKLTETESEFEDHRRKNLEQQQILRRKLQDEINKN